VKARKKRKEEEGKGLSRGGRGCDGCSPKVCVDIPVVGGEGYLVVPSACL